MSGLAGSTPGVPVRHTVHEARDDELHLRGCAVDDDGDVRRTHGREDIDVDVVRREDGVGEARIRPEAIASLGLDRYLSLE